MTREEKIAILKDIIDGEIINPQVRKDVGEWAIKALEQEPILDRVRAEIEKEIIPRNSDQYDHEAMWQNLGLRMALKVIDKYKADRSVEDENHT